MVEGFLVAAFIGVLVQTDVSVVHAPGAGEWGTVQLVEQATIGTLDGPEEVVFERIAAVSLGLDGVVYVADGGIPVIRRYGQDGRYLGDVGREGEGPGEYLQIWGMKVLPDGRLAVWDPANRRVSLFAPDGAFVRSFVVETGSWRGDGLQVDGQGRLYVRSSLRGGGGGESRDGWLRFSPEGELLDTVRSPREESSESFMLSTSDGPRRPFSVRTVSALNRHGSPVWARNDAYSIFQSLPDGRRLEIRRPYVPVRVNDAERKQWEAFAEYMEQGARDLGREVQAVTIPTEKPPFRGLLTDGDGRIWVSIYSEAYEADLSEEYLNSREGRPIYRWRERSQWEIFAADGSFLGSVTLPNGHRFMAARGSILITETQGAWDESYIVVSHMLYNN